MKKYNSIIYILVAAVALQACGGKKETVEDTSFYLSDTMMKHTEFAEVTMSNVSNGLKLYGKITADNSRQAQVFPAVGGSVIKVNVELGDYVKQGQVLAVIRSSEVAEYERQRMDANNDVVLAEKNLQVAQDLYAGKLTAEKDVVLAEKELQKAKALQQSVNEIFQIYNIGKGAVYNVVAPLSGFVVDKNITENMQLRSDKGESIFSIAQIENVWVLANVNESEIRKVTIGMEAEIKTISYPDITFKGQVDRVFNVLDDNTKSMKARIIIPNKDLLLKPEMSATVSLLQREDKKMLAIPSSAVIFDKSREWVMIYKDRKNIETRQVEVYNQFGDTTYIKNGLTEGEKVISKNQLLIYDALND